MKRITSRLFCLMLISGLLAVSCQSASAKPKRGGGQPPPQDSNQNAPPPTSAPSNNSAQITQDLADLKAAETAVHETFETSSEWLAAQAAVKQAQNDYDGACGPVLEALKSEPKYSDAVSAQTKAEADLKDLQTTGSPDQISDAAQTSMQARSTVKAMEGKALQSDPTTSAARQKLIAANAALAQLRQKEQDAVHADPTWIAAKKNLDAARGK